MRKIGSFQILDKLGETSTNTLLVGEHEQSHKLAVVRMANTPDWNEQVQVKGAMLSSVKHSAVVEVYEQGTQRGEATGALSYFAMEYARGKMLAELMERHREIPLKEKLDLLIKVCEGVHALNGSGHVCLCTPNDIVVKSDTSVKITDVHAKLPPNLQTSARVIQNKDKRIPVWTPELIMGTADRDRREDVFAVGLLTYVFVAGEDPFRAAIPIDRAEKVMAESAAPLSKVAHAIPPALEVAVKKALKKDRNLRQQTVRELGAELRLIAVGL